MGLFIAHKQMSETRKQEAKMYLTLKKKKYKNTTVFLTYGKTLTQRNDISLNASTQPWRTGRMGINASSKERRFNLCSCNQVHE